MAETDGGDCGDYFLKYSSQENSLSFLEACLHLKDPSTEKKRTVIVFLNYLQSFFKFETS